MSGEQGEKVYVRNRRCYTSLDFACSNQGNLGRFAVRTRSLPQVVGVMGNSWPGLPRWGQEITVKVYGVAVVMPQG